METATFWIISIVFFTIEIATFSIALVVYVLLVEELNQKKAAKMDLTRRSYGVLDKIVPQYSRLDKFKFLNILSSIDSTQPSLYRKKITLYTSLIIFLLLFISWFVFIRVFA